MQITKFYEYQFKIIDQTTPEGIDRVWGWIEKWVPADHPDYEILKKQAADRRAYLVEMGEKQAS